MRVARVVVEGVPYHITQRGNYRQDVFLSPEDRRFYLDLLRAKCTEHGVAVLGYCLMTNHMHLVAIPKRANVLARRLTTGFRPWLVCGAPFAGRRHRRCVRSGHGQRSHRSRTRRRARPSLRLPHRAKPRVAIPSPTSEPGAEAPGHSAHTKPKPDPDLREQVPFRWASSGTAP
ncbi:MAG: transposase [Bryobacterales bacterium]|nr:transposase [Bryobacterales bacterium]